MCFDSFAKDTKQRLGRIVCPRCQYSPAPNEAPFILILSLQQENDERFNKFSTKNCFFFLILILCFRLLNTLIREFQPQQESQIWCVKCVSVAKKECLEKHYTVDMTSKTATDCLELKQALVRFKSQAKIPLQKRQERKMKLNEILRCLKVVETDIQNQLNENNERISQLISMADGVLENSSPEPFHVLKSRLELANQLSDEELLKVKEVEAAEQSEKSMEFWFQFETSGGRIIESLPYSSNIGTASSSSANITTSTEDFETNTGILNCQKTLMSHLIVSSLRKQGRTSAPARENVKVEMNPIRPPVRPISPPPSARRPQYRFVVQAHTGRILTGEFAFEPSANLNATFLRHLVKCFRNRQEEHYSTQLTHVSRLVLKFSCGDYKLIALHFYFNRRLTMVLW